MQSLATNRINLKLLQTFMIVAENRSFREAADQVGRSQSAISTQIRQLEDQLGLPLFNRTTRQVNLTPEGAELLAHARRAVGEVEQGLRHIMEAADLRRGRVTLACAPTIASTRLPHILAAFEKDHPDIRIVVHELKSVDLFQRIRDGEVDFGLGPVIGDGDLDFRTVLREDVHIFASPRFLPDDHKTIAFDDLADIPLIQFPMTTVMGQMIAATAHARGITLNTRYECVQGQTLIALASAGLGAAVMTGTLIRSAAGSGMRRPRIVDPGLTQDFAIVTLKGKTLSPTAQHLAGLIAAKMPPIKN
ncbi:LysR family transcriptional regulator [Cereibacter sp. SYSU M97828]|nr:LysR family transcriptional regulator [Cereibacter flavus]